MLLRYGLTPAAALVLLAAGCGGGGGSGAQPTPTATPTSTASVVTFSPAAVTLNNPTAPSLSAAQSSFTVDLTAFDSSGAPLTPTASNPITVNLYGVPAGVITPTTLKITSGTTATFQYNGGYFPNPIALQAWIADPAGGAAIGVTQIVGQNRLPCSAFGSQSYQVPLQDTVPDPLQVYAAVGKNSPQATDFQIYTIDTGSLGTIVPIGDINSSDVIGPGAPGVKFYDSSGNTYSGNYYLATVSIQLSGGAIVQTHPIEVLAIDKAYCSGSRTKECEKHPPQPTLRYLGVGFDRENAGSGDLFASPAQNAFLQLTDAADGTDIAQGYTLSQNGVTLGVTSASASGFSMISLSPSSKAAGEWATMPGCFGFPGIVKEPFCGSLLLDVGISEMFLDLARSSIPRKADSHDFVPSGTQMSIAAGDVSNPAMSYSFTAVSQGQQPSGLAPDYVQWIKKPNVFVNTGRYPLLGFNYLYDAQCGQTGFAQVQ